jgi:hypothetical protein
MKLEAFCRDCNEAHVVRNVQDFECIEVDGCGKRRGSPAKKCRKCGRTFLAVHFRNGERVCSYCRQEERNGVLR